MRRMYRSMSIERMNRKNRNQSRIRILISMLVLMSTFFLAGCSQPKVYRVGVLSGLSFFEEITVGFKARLTELGYIEGKNITYDVQNTEFDMAAYDRILKDFVADKVDLILVFPTEASQQAKAVTEGTGIPVVFANAFIEGMGLVQSVQEPGGNMTGVRWPGPEIVARCFEVLLELVPGTKRMFVCYHREYPIVKSQLDTLRPLASVADITLIEVPATTPGNLETALQEQPGPFDASVLHLLAEPLVVTPEGIAVVTRFAARHTIPIGGAAIFEGSYQSLFSITPEPVSQGRQAAYLADKIFKGAPAGTLPVLTADYFFIFNYRQAETLKLNIPESLLSQADQVLR